MAVPKKKMSQSRRNSRRAHNFRLEVPNLSICPNCKNATRPHHVCPSCGQYQGRQVVAIESKSAAQ